MALAGLPIEEREMILDLLSQIRQRMLTPEQLREWDEEEIFPEAEIRELLGPDIGLQLLFLPEEYGGLGGGARDMAACLRGAGKICLGVATAFLVIHLGSDPILVARDGAPEAEMADQGGRGRARRLRGHRGRGWEQPLQPQDHGDACSCDDGEVTGYRINGSKQFISNGGFADFLTVLAQAPEGPSFFVVEKTMEGFFPGKPEQKHGIRSSNTVALTFDNVFVPVENLVGGVPGQGLGAGQRGLRLHRLMVAALALGAGVAALEKVIAYAKERVQFGSPLIEKQGYTHKLILPFVAQLEAARAYIEEVAARLDAGESDLQAEGSIAKLFATEVANACADAAIQALGGYGYVKEYDVEKIKRDVKITTIYEGTSEIQQLIVSTFRWRESVKTKGASTRLWRKRMDGAHAQHPSIKADVVAGIVRLLNRLFEEVHEAKATRQQHIMFQLASLASVAETGAALVSKTVQDDDRGDGLASEKTEYLEACARVNAGLAAQKAFSIANEILLGSGRWSAVRGSGHS